MTRDGTIVTLIGNLRRRIGEKEFSFTFTRSGGPGGQNVNKVNTRVTLWFDVEGSASLGVAEKAAIRERLGGRISKDGRLHIVSMRHRTQAANRAAALDRFYILLTEALRPRVIRKPTRKPRSAKERRLAEKQRVGERKRLRSEQAFDAAPFDFGRRGG